MKFFVIFALAVSGPALGTIEGASSSSLAKSARVAAGWSADEKEDSADPFDELFGAKKSLVVFKRKKVAFFENVEFEPGRSTLNAKNQEVLTQVSSILLERPDITLLHVDAHTDSLGPASSNQKLSLARARAVVAFLVDQGVDSKRLVAVGHGESKPVMPNDSDENRAANRRTEIRIMSFTDRSVTMAKAQPKASKAKLKATELPLEHLR